MIDALRLSFAQHLLSEEAPNSDNGARHGTLILRPFPWGTLQSWELNRMIYAANSGRLTLRMYTACAAPLFYGSCRSSETCVVGWMDEWMDGRTDRWEGGSKGEWVEGKKEGREEIEEEEERRDTEAKSGGFSKAGTRSQSLSLSGIQRSGMRG